MDLIEKFNLPPYIKGKSFAEASKSIMDKFKDKNDRTSKQTMAQLLSRLKDAQEYTKQQEAMQAADDFFFGGMVKDYALGGTLSDPKKKTSEKWEPMPSDNDPKKQAELREHWANRMGINAEELGAFEDQRVADEEYRKKKESYLEEQMKVWRQQYTGHNKNEKFSQTTPEYKTAIDGYKDTWFKENPRQVNEVVQKYREKRIKDTPLNKLFGSDINNTRFATGSDNENDFFLGGLMGGGQGNPNIQEQGEAEGEGASVGDYMTAAKGALEAGNNMFGKVNPNNVDPDGKSISGGEGALSGTMKGAQAGMAFGPWGAAIGGVVGGVSGIVGAGKQNDAMNQAQANRDHLERNKAMGNFAKGGTMRIKKRNSYDIGGLLGNKGTNSDTYEEMFSRLATQNKPIEATPMGLDISPESMLQKSAENVTNKISNTNFGNTDSTDPSFLDKSASWLDKNKYDIGRTAPIIANAAQLLSMKRPQKEQLAKLGNRYKKQLADEASAVNQISNATNKDLATETSGGSRSRAAATSRALQRDKMGAVSKAYDAISAQNRQEGRTEQQFNLGVDEFNTKTRQLESENYAKDKGAFETNKSTLIAALGENVGDFSTERMRDDMIKQLFDYTRKGDYIKSKIKVNDQGGYLDEAFKVISKAKKRIKKKTNKDYYR